ncbi:MAG: NAD(P)-binding domain-containing protein [Cytophagales bacterium]|nr:NAD(P)-binding domain-containing protein [Cytophagales bacterium]
MPNYFNITLIGAGNVGWHLALALENAGHRVKEVFSPNPKHASELVEKLYDGQVVKIPDFAQSSSEVFLICVRDAFVQRMVADCAFPPQAVVAHTAGALGLEVLQNATPKI